jgi:hypothetical protein
MIRWQVVAESEAEKEWNMNLLRFADYSLFQTYEWGEYKSRFGWTVYRCAAFDDEGVIVTMLQGLIRIYPFGTGIIWVPGGPGGDLSAIGRDLFGLIKRTAGLKRFFLRLFPTRGESPADELVLLKCGMRKAQHAINSGLSMLYDLTPGKELPRATKNWRHNLKRSEKYNLSVYLWVRPDIELIMSVYEYMESMKNIVRQYSREELSGLFESLGERIKLYRCDNADGELLGFRGCAVFGEKGWDLFAAVTEEGRKVYASYALFEALMRHCRAAGVLHYDMGGVDPVGNPGVYDFKKGAGAVIYKYLGEWDWATSIPLRWVSNWAISRKRGGL